MEIGCVGQINATKFLYRISTKKQRQQRCAFISLSPVIQDSLSAASWRPAEDSLVETG